MDRIYRALADPTRRRILRMLAEGERTQSDLVAALGVSQPAVVKHVRALREAGLIHERREGRWCLYSLNEETAARAYAELRREWEELLGRRLADLKRYLESPKEDER